MTTIDATPLPTLPPLGCAPNGPACRGQRGKVFVLCEEATLGKGERHTVASIVLDRTVNTFAELTHTEASVLIDALNGWHAVGHLIDTARPWTQSLLGSDVPCATYEPNPNEFRQPASRDQIDRIAGLCGMIGLDRLDVFDLALFSFGVEITDWTELYPSGAQRLTNALRGFLDVLAARPYAGT